MKTTVPLEWQVQMCAGGDGYRICAKYEGYWICRRDWRKRKAIVKRRGVHIFKPREDERGGAR